MKHSIINHKEQILSKFKCQNSGNCCKQPGYVYVNSENMQDMSAILNLPLSDFKAEYTQQLNSYDVIASTHFRPNCFLDCDNKCQVYKARPSACKSYPDWPSIWQSEANLEAEASVCPGLRKAIKEVLNQH